MKFTLALLLCVPLVFAAGCPSSTATTPATPAVLAPGYINSADQQMGELLAGARSFYTTIQQESLAGTLTLTATEKTAFNALGVSINAASTVYVAYHQGTATEAQASAAIAMVKTKQAALPVPAVQ